jgi:ureidoacrylate peracid hydrolase
MADVLLSLDAILAPARSALLVVDLQNDFIHPDGWSARHHPGGPSLRHVLSPVNALIRAARGAAVPVVYIDAFEGTALHDLLRGRGVETVVGTGVVTNLCVQTTVQHAFALGYYVVVAEDATAAVDPTVQAVTLANFRQFFGPVETSEVIGRHWRDSRPRGSAPA